MNTSVARKIVRASLLLFIIIAVYCIASMPLLPPKSRLHACTLWSWNSRSLVKLRVILTWARMTRLLAFSAPFFLLFSTMLLLLLCSTQKKAHTLVHKKQSAWRHSEQPAQPNSEQPAPHNLEQPAQPNSDPLEEFLISWLSAIWNNRLNPTWNNRLHPTQNNRLHTTRTHLTQFGTTGLKSLCWRVHSWSYFVSLEYFDG